MYIYVLLFYVGVDLYYRSRVPKVESSSSVCSLKLSGFYHIGDPIW